MIKSNSLALFLHEININFVNYFLESGKIGGKGKKIKVCITQTSRDRQPNFGVINNLFGINVWLSCIFFFFWKLCFKVIVNSTFYLERVKIRRFRIAFYNVINVIRIRTVSRLNYFFFKKKKNIKIVKLPHFKRSCMISEPKAIKIM